MSMLRWAFVIPELDMVVIFTSSVSPSSGVIQPAILFDYIIPAVMNENPQLVMIGGSITFTALAITLPILVAGVYYRIRIRNWSKELV